MRIANKIGKRMAFEVYSKLFKATIETIQQSNTAYHIYISEPTESLLNSSFKLQQGHDLGDRMNNAFVTELKENKKVCLIGGDCLDLSPSDLTEAFKSLDHHDLVIGPSFDGGYYLIGMKQPSPEIFKSIEWSTSTVFDETISIATKKKLAIHILPKRRDVDNVEDIPEEWLQSLKK